MQLADNVSNDKLRGGFYTPNKIASFILKWAFNGRKDIDILEPSCGDGVFLREIQEGKYEYNSFLGIEFFCLYAGEVLSELCVKESLKTP
jgi:adenine-specific DNA-methyltransferase